MSAPPAPLASLLQDGSLSALVSLSVELQPLRTADELAALLLAVRKYPVGLPRRDEMIAVALGGVYTGAQLAALIARLDSAGPSLLWVGSSLPQAHGWSIPTTNCNLGRVVGPVSWDLPGP